MRNRHRAAAFAAATAVGLATVLAQAPGAAAESLPLPLAGSTLIEGHGFGHGIGMSQWGAYGAATKGLSHNQIMDFYYPGTSAGTVASSQVRVRLTTTPSSSVTAMVTTGGLRLVRANGSTLTLGTTSPEGTITRWRLLPDAGGQTLQWYSGGVWHTGKSFVQTRETLGFAGASNETRVLRTSSVARSYPGYVVSVPLTSSLRPVNVTTYDAYLRGVVPNEMPASWPAAAVRSQAIAARTYAAHESSGGTSEICDTTQCQVYDGLADYTLTGTLSARYTDSRSDAAITATAGGIRTYQGTPAFTQFSASNGGYSVAGSRPYLVARADPYDGAVPNSANTWTVTSSTVVSRIQSAWPAVGAVRSIEAVRDGRGEWGGRMTSAVITGTAGRQSVSASSLRDVLGLRTTWFTVRNADLLRRDVDLNGSADVVALRTDGSLVRQGLNGTALSGATLLGGGWGAMGGVAAAGDLTGDGVGDLVARTSDGAWWCYPMRSTGKLTTRTRIAAVGTSTLSLSGVGDVTGDGKPDLVGVDRSTGILWLYAGTGGCTVGARSSLGGNWNSMNLVIGAADTTGDGRGDLWAREAATGILWNYPFNGAGGFAGPRVSAGGGWAPMRDLAPVGDANRDGAADLLVRDASGAAWLYPGRGNGTFGTRSAVTGLGAPTYVR